jgi:hypothetical protein
MEKQMTTVTFDTHTFIRRLETAGFTREQAEALADAFRGALEDQKPMARDCLDYGLKTDLARMKADLIQWMTGALIVQAAVIATLVKLL